MIISLRRIIARMQFMILFLALTVLAYSLLQLASHWIDPVDKYKLPSGHSMKVFQQEQHALIPSILDQLRFFYWYGE